MVLDVALLNTQKLKVKKNLVKGLKIISYKLKVKKNKLKVKK